MKRVLVIPCLFIILPLSSMEKQEAPQQLDSFKSEIKQLIVNEMQRLNDEQALRDAASAHDLKKVKEHIAQGVDVNAKNEFGFTALMVALNKDMERIRQDKMDEVVSTLIAEGAYINDQENHGRTALYFAAYNGHSKAVEMLLNKNADPNISSVFKNTPLDRSISAFAYDRADRKPPYRKIIELLLNKNAKTNIVWGNDNEYSIKRLATDDSNYLTLTEKSQLLDLLRRYGLQD